jgi:predicted secreted protein
MFDDARSKKIIFIAHCMLNQNSVSDGTAEYPGSIQEIIRFIIDSNIGIVQMPCPEFLCLGLDRGNAEGRKSPVVEENTRIRTQMKRFLVQDKINKLVRNLVFQITEYKNHGFDILGIIGINRSPSCGVDTTSDHNKEISGRGIFIGLMNEALQNKGLFIKIIGINASEIDMALSSVKGLIESH